MRLFVAIDFPKSIKDRLQSLQIGIPVARWNNPQQFHLTLSFIGETEQIEAVKKALAEVQGTAFELKLTGVGYFPIQSEPPAQVLYVGVETQSALIRLQQQIVMALVARGFILDSRPFLPHVTLAYINTQDFLPEIKQFLETNQAFQIDPITVSEFILFSSDMSSGIVSHEHEAVYALNTS